MESLKLAAIDYRVGAAAERFVDSLRHTGFGVLSHHPVDAALVDRIYATWSEFFASEAKYDFLFDRQRQDGFFPGEVSEIAKGGAIKDIKEYFHYYPWGRCPAALRADLDCYYSQALGVAEGLLAWVEQQMPGEIAKGLSEPLSSMIAKSSRTLLRILHYPKIDNREIPAGALRAAAHEDINLLTILPVANAPGLELLDREGSWQALPCDPGQLVVNVGDMLQEVTGGWLPSTTHRVVNPEAGGAARMSLPLFLHPRPEVLLSTRYTAESYLAERLSELGVL